jgi:acyl-CoA dehydrogenase
VPWNPATLLRPGALGPVPDAAAWRGVLDELERDGPFALAVYGGRRSATVGWAFAFGYQAALRALLPAHAPGRIAALCATEAGGHHPRAIQTRLVDGRLSGRKSFVSMGPLADLLVVVARAGEDAAGRPRLVTALVDRDGPGVSVVAAPPLPFVPEIPHGELVLDDAPAPVVLPGDGYTGALKPFRTIEDVHVHAAVAAWLVGVAQGAGWPDDIVESLLVCIAALGQAALLPPDDAGTHRLLGGALAAFHAVADRLEPLWASAPSDLAAVWARDRALTHIAGAARRARLDRARLVATGGAHVR